MTMENKQPISEWDKQVCAHLDELWNKHHAGELEPVDAIDIDNIRVQGNFAHRK